MIATTIGRTFLKAFYQKTGNNYSAKEFFEKEFFELFYNHPKYMQWVTNSPFVQGLRSNPKGEYGVNETLKGESGKKMLFQSDSHAVKYIKDNVLKRVDFLYCLMPNFVLTKKGKEYITSLEYSDIKDFGHLIKDSDFYKEIYFEHTEQNTWKLSELGLQKIQELKFNSREEALSFFSDEFVQTKAFFQLNNNNKISSKGIEFLKTLNEIERKKLLNDFIVKAENAAKKDLYDGSIVVGFPASEAKEFAVASGQVTDIKFNHSIEDIYLSWIGSGLGIGIAGGYTIYFDDAELLFSIYQGWEIYRELLDDSIINHQGKQVDTWNGQWLSYRYDKRYNGNNDFVSLQNHGVFKKDDKGLISVETVPWSKLLFKISMTVSTSHMLGFIGNFSKTNKTLGFYQFMFNDASRLIGFYKKLFGENAALNDANRFENIFGLELRRACSFGVIGLQALEPSSLRDKYGNFKELKLIKPKLSNDEEKNNRGQQNDYENLIYYQTYKTWLLAMITKNKEESLEYTKEVAEALHAYIEKAEKNDRKNLIQSNLLVSKSKKQFLDSLTEIIKDVEMEKIHLFKSLRDRVHLMNMEDFGYFVVLLKFDFAYVERELNQ